MKKYVIGLIMLSSVVFATPVFAGEECTTSTGSYGQTSVECKLPAEKTEQVYHDAKKIDSGVGSFSFWTIAQLLTMVSMTGFGLAKLAERTYWLD